MNMEELVTLYKQGIRDFSDQSMRKIDLDSVNFYTLRNSNFQKSDLSEANLTGADFSKANCQATQFCEAILRNAKLKRSNCQQANFLGADLRNADFLHCDLAGADFTGADLRGAKLKLAILDTPEYGSVNLHGIIYNCHTEFPETINPETLEATNADAMSDQDVKRLQAEILINLSPSLAPGNLSPTLKSQQAQPIPSSSPKTSNHFYPVKSREKSSIRTHSNFYAALDQFLHPKNTKTFGIKIADHNNINMRKYFSIAWKITQEKFGIYVGFVLIIAGISLALSRISGIGQFSLIAIIGPLSAGLLLVPFKILKNRPVSFEDFFQGFNRFLPLFLEFIVKAIILCVSFICFVIPAIYFSVSYLFSVPLILDRKLDFWPALELSRYIVSKHWADYFVFTFILFIINLFGFIPSGLGLLITIPFTYNAIAAAYDDIVGITSN